MNYQITPTQLKQLQSVLGEVDLLKAQVAALLDAVPSAKVTA